MVSMQIPRWIRLLKYKKKRRDFFPVFLHPVLNYTFPWMFFFFFFFCFFFVHFTLESYIGIFRSYRQTHNLVKIVFFFFFFFFAGFGVYFFLYVSNGTGLIVWTGSRTFYPNWIDEKHCFDSLLRVDSWLECHIISMDNSCRIRHCLVRLSNRIA